MKIKKQSGFTLIEIMIVVAIIGILSAIAYPSYVKSVQKSKRSDAKIELLRIAQMQESYFAQNMSYAKDLTQLGLSTTNTIASEQNEYNVTVLARTPADCTGDDDTPCVSFTLSAVPSGSQTNDTDCLRFTLASSGQKGTVANASAQAIRTCWR